MSIIHFIGGEKGGVGKSVFSRLLSQYFLDHSIDYLGFDADQSHATLTRYYQDYTSAIELDHFESIDQIMELALESDRHLLIDLPAQNQRFLDRWIDDNSVLEMCIEMNIPLVYWYLVDDGRDSVSLLDNFINKYNDMLHCIAIKNEGRGNDFTEINNLLDNLTKEQRYLQRGILPSLHGSTMHKIDKLDFSFWAAANAKDKEFDHLSIMERQRTRVWLKKSYAMIEEKLGNV